MFTLNCQQNCECFFNPLSIPFFIFNILSTSDSYILYVVRFGEKALKFFTLALFCPFLSFAYSFACSFGIYRLWIFLFHVFALFGSALFPITLSVLLLTFDIILGKTRFYNGVYMPKIRTVISFFGIFSFLEQTHEPLCADIPEGWWRCGLLWGCSVTIMKSPAE